MRNTARKTIIISRLWRILNSNTGLRPGAVKMVLSLCPVKGMAMTTAMCPSSAAAAGDKEKIKKIAGRFGTLPTPAVFGFYLALFKDARI